MKKQKTLRELGFRRQRDPLLKIFGPPGPAPRKPDPIVPDFGLPDQKHTPQAPEYAEIFIEAAKNFGNVRNPLQAPASYFEG